MTTGTVNSFRKARGRRLKEKITKLGETKNKKLTVLDVGGRAEYWRNVGIEGISEIILLNNDEAENTEDDLDAPFVRRMGDARDLHDYPDQSIDLVHSNSVIEHVGTNDDMLRMANECLRVGTAGWVQTPAWEFPIEPHFRQPFFHWFGRPVQRACLRFSSAYGALDINGRRRHVDRINLLAFSEVRALFPESDIWVERFMLFPKSYVVTW